MDKKTEKDILKICIFITLANLPFITMTQQIGTDTFLDSFENPNHYNYLKFTPLAEDSYIQNEDYILLQRSSHPEFSVSKEDIVVYYKDGEGLCCNKIYNVDSNLPIKKYYTIGCTSHNNKPIYEHNILGKVVGILDDNIWNSLSIKTWETSINNLNIKALFTDN